MAGRDLIVDAKGKEARDTKIRLQSVFATC